MAELRSVWFYSTSRGWVKGDDPGDAMFRLSADARIQHYVQIQNSLEQVNPRGGWMEVSPETETLLPAIERALVFQLRPIQNERGSFVEIVSKRYLDADLLATLYADLIIYDKHGQPLNQPELALDRPCIEPSAAAVFSERVAARGGQVVESQADLQSMLDALRKLTNTYRELEQICTLSRSVIVRVAEGIRSDAPSISERSKTAHYLRDQAAEQVEFIRSEKLSLDAQPGQIEYKAHAGAYLQRAEMLLGYIEKLHREHKSYEIQAVARINQEALSASLPSVDAPASTRRYLFIPVVEYYTELNQDCRLTPEGMVLRVGDVTIELGEQIKALASHEPTAAPTAQRTPVVDRGERSI